MFLSKRNIYIFLFIYVFILILFYSSINFNRINYLTDNIKSFFCLDGGSKGNNEFKIIDINNQYIKPYKNIPENFIHFGNDLFIGAKKGTSVKDIARAVISYTNYYKSYELQNAIMKCNGLNTLTIIQDMFIYIPDTLPPIISSLKRNKKPDLIYSRGLYFTGYSTGSEKFPDTIAKLKELGINTIVFDAKDVTGDVNYFSSVPEVQRYNTHEKRTIDNIDMLLRILKREGIYSIARIAVFRDHLLAKKNQDFGIKSKSTGRLWNGTSNEIWCDPTNKSVQDYNIQLAIELAEMGIDEIQFDYIRFPTKGDLRDAGYVYHYGKMTKESAITSFLKRAYDEISKKNSLLSIDIFGVMAWEKEIDIEKTGQRVQALSIYCDILCPMLYPSHFENDFDGFPNPGDEPYYFIYEGSKKMNSLAGGKHVRPWLQAFGWRISADNYNEDYILKQISGCRDSGAFGYLFWNASNSYDLVYKTFYKIAAMKKDEN